MATEVLDKSKARRKGRCPLPERRQPPLRTDVEPSSASMQEQLVDKDAYRSRINRTSQPKLKPSIRRKQPGLARLELCQ